MIKYKVIPNGSGKLLSILTGNADLNIAAIINFLVRICYNCLYPYIHMNLRIYTADN